MRERFLLRILAGVVALAALYFGVPEYRRRTLGSVTLEEMTRCATAADCVAVECASGCGGTSCGEIVNRKFEGAWYYQKRCAPPGPDRLAPAVWHAPSEIVCSQGRCGSRLSERTEAPRATRSPSP